MYRSLTIRKVVLCVAFAVTGFIVSASGASAAHLHHAARAHGGDRAKLHRAAGRFHSFRRLAGSRHVQHRLAEHGRGRARFALTRHGHASRLARHASRFAKYGRSHMARRVASQPASGMSATGGQTGGASFYRGGGRARRCRHLRPSYPAIRHKGTGHQPAQRAASRAHRQRSRTVRARAHRRCIHRCGWPPRDDRVGHRARESAGSRVAHDRVIAPSETGEIIDPRGVPRRRTPPLTANLP